MPGMMEDLFHSTMPVRSDMLKLSNFYSVLELTLMPETIGIILLYMKLQLKGKLMYV